MINYLWHLQKLETLHAAQKEIQIPWSTTGICCTSWQYHGSESSFYLCSPWGAGKDGRQGVKLWHRGFWKGKACLINQLEFIEDMNTRVDMGKAANTILLRFSGYIEHRSTKEVSAYGWMVAGGEKRPWEVRGHGERVGDQGGGLTGATFLSATSPCIAMTSVPSPICPTRQEDQECAVDAENLTHHFHVFIFSQECNPQISNPSHSFTKLAWYNCMALWLLIQVSCSCKRCESVQHGHFTAQRLTKPRAQQMALKYIVMCFSLWSTPSPGLLCYPLL